MRFLKIKIRLAHDALLRRESSQSILSSPNSTHSADQKDEQFILKKTGASSGNNKLAKSPQRISKGDSKSAFSNPTKNIIINYGNAIATFAASKLALPYLEKYINSQTITQNGFTAFIIQAKARITGLEGFKSLLVTKDTDSEEIVLYKKIFQELCEIFIKYFSVNWIIHGRVSNKIVYLKYRFDIMRRIQNPEQFTYLKDTRC